MKIRIRYDNEMTTIDVPEEEFSVMVRLDYEERLAQSDDPASVSPRTPQEIMDERFNRPDYNNWHKLWRHIDDKAVPPKLDHKARYLARPDDGDCPALYTLDDFPDTAEPAAQEARDKDEEMRAMIRKTLKPAYADMVIAIHLDGTKIVEYAAQIGDLPNNVSHRLRRAEKKLKEIFKKRPV